MKKYILFITAIVVVIFSFWFFYLKDKRKNDLMIIGKELVNKVDNYERTHHRLPNSLLEIGVKENQTTVNQFSYEKVDSIYYFIWLGISSEESKFYYSDTKNGKIPIVK